MAALPEPSPRLRSLDALRGFDMLWIIGLATLVHELATATGAGWLRAWALQLEHVEWDGLRAYDLVFPLFMFLSGVSVPYAQAKRSGLSTGRRLAAVWRRAAVLVLLGIIYNGGLALRFDTQRYASVLGQIGLAYGIAASVFLLTPGWRSRAVVAAAILAVISLLQLAFPVPGHGAGVLTPEGIVNGWLDRRLLPGRLHGGVFDPEGILCVVSAAALTLAGVMTGDYIRRRGPSHIVAGHLLMAGAVLLVAGWACWQLGYPPIKAAWTTPFNLLAGGICLWLFTGFHLLLDFRPVAPWSFPLEVVGMNPLTIYLAERVLSFDEISAFFFGGIAARCGTWEGVVLTVGVLAIEWLLLWFLWKKRVLLRV
jgi:predicted acyltransferase